MTLAANRLTVVLSNDYGFNNNEIYDIQRIMVQIDDEDAFKDLAYKLARKLGEYFTASRFKCTKIVSKCGVHMISFNDYDETAIVVVDSEWL